MGNLYLLPYTYRGALNGYNIITCLIFFTELRCLRPLVYVIFSDNQIFRAVLVAGPRVCQCEKLELACHRCHPLLERQWQASKTVNISSEDTRLCGVLSTSCLANRRRAP
ncbi:hypothetical protein M404DRAFT_862519 [Pisolithus tinctorius Marx 270]|uniref:Uncharacterized protein n=1 Tax=Pisolithus tinctorius Marx 270 TaxID=870435 RepID=A0A0C3JKK4_PISTI|nr:hypothetical protein M404DRAFT_862519 [Pisolithus tinctorius Marx 270]